MKTDAQILPMGKVNFVLGNVLEELKQRDDMFFAHGINTLNQHSGGIARGLDVLTDGALTAKAEHWETPPAKLRSGYPVEWNGNIIYNSYSQLNPGADATYGTVFWAYEDIFFFGKDKFTELNTVLIGSGIGGLKRHKVFDIVKLMATRYPFYETINIWMDEASYNQVVKELAKAYGECDHVTRFHEEQIDKHIGE